MAKRPSLLPALERAATLAGGQAALAKACGVDPSTVWHWIHRMHGKPPAQYVATIIIACNREVTKHELRPDLFPAPQGASSRRPQ